MFHQSSHTHLHFPTNMSAHNDLTDASTVEQETDMEIIRQYMVGDVNARVKCVTVDVLSGVVGWGSLKFY